MNARCPPSANDAETAKALLSTRPFLFILSATPKVDALVTTLPRSAIAEILFIPTKEPSLFKGLLSNFETINIKGSAPERVTQALAQTNAAFSKVSKLGLISIFVRKVNTAQTRPIIEMVFIM